jgi:hypothetical protein
MEQSSILIIAFLVLIVLGFIHSRAYTPTTTTKTVVVNDDPYYRHYGYRSPPPPPPHYNPYKSQYYN